LIIDEGYWLEFGERPNPMGYQNIADLEPGRRKLVGVN